MTHRKSIYFFTENEVIYKNLVLKKLLFKLNKNACDYVSAYRIRNFFVILYTTKLDLASVVDKKITIDFPNNFYCFLKVIGFN